MPQRPASRSFQFRVKRWPSLLISGLVPRPALEARHAVGRGRLMTSKLNPSINGASPPSAPPLVQASAQARSRKQRGPRPIETDRRTEPPASVGAAVDADVPDLRAAGQPAGPSIMLVSSDEDRRLALREGLAARGLKVVLPADPAMIEAVAFAATVDAILLDLGPDTGQALDLIRRLAALRSPPVIVLDVEPDEADRIVALEVGADECLSRTISLRELHARLRAIARRAAMLGERSAERLSTRFAFAGWRLCLKTRELRAPDMTPLYLAANEISLLQAFVEHPREVLERPRLRELVNEADTPTGQRMVDWRVSRLRYKLEKTSQGGAELIKTVRQRGYSFEADVRTL